MATAPKKAPKTPYDPSLGYSGYKKTTPKKSTVSELFAKVNRAGKGLDNTLATAGKGILSNIQVAAGAVNPFASSTQRANALNDLVNVRPNQYNTAVGNTISLPVANIISESLGIPNLAKAKSIADKKGFGSLKDPSYLGNIAAFDALATTALLSGGTGNVGKNVLKKVIPKLNSKVATGAGIASGLGFVLGEQAVAKKVAGPNTVTSPYNKLVDPNTGLLKPGYSAQQSLATPIYASPNNAPVQQGNTTEFMPLPLPLNLRTPSPETIVPLTDTITSNTMDTFGGAIANPILGTASTGSDVNTNIPPAPMLGVQGSTDGVAVGPATTMQTGIPNEVASATAAYNAALASAANQSYQNQIALRDQAATNMMQSQGVAADIIGGTAPALLGQFLTGDRRTMQQGVSAETQRAIQNQIALEQTYNEAVKQAYTAQAIANQKAASDRAALAAAIKGLGL
jgi:hypothetical protein